jgi:hypothetical protein
MGLIDRAKDVAGDAVGKATKTAGPVWDKTKDVAGDAVVKATQSAGPPGTRPKMSRARSSARRPTPPDRCWIRPRPPPEPRVTR